VPVDAAHLLLLDYFALFSPFSYISLEMQVGACLDEIHLRVLVDQGNCSGLETTFPTNSDSSNISTKRDKRKKEQIIQNDKCW
jgi:hypothetical protein